MCMVVVIVCMYGGKMLVDVKNCMALEEKSASVRDTGDMCQDGTT